jgi:hypothetical protein
VFSEPALDTSCGGRKRETADRHGYNPDPDLDPGHNSREKPGAVAQLVERIVRNDEVGSSTLLRSTLRKPLQTQGFFAFGAEAEKPAKTGHGKMAGKC